MGRATSFIGIWCTGFLFPGDAQMTAVQIIQAGNVTGLVVVLPAEMGSGVKRLCI